MDLDAVHEMSSFSDQGLMPVSNHILEESMPYEAAFSYDELFPSLPENEQKPETPTVDMGQWTQKMKLKSTVITQVFRVPVEERKFRDINNQRFGEQGEQAKICADIMQKTGAHIEISSSKDQSLTILVTGKEEAVLKARRHIVKELQQQAMVSISIPKEHYRYILGKGGKKLADLELSTATKISVPRPDDNSDLIRITGTKECIDKARHEIQLISDEQGKLAFERLKIPKIYHPFIFGAYSKTLNQIIDETGARINIPPASIMKDELTIAGEKEAVLKAKQQIEHIYEERKRSCQTISVEIPKSQHKYIIGIRGQTIQEILAETGVSVEMPPTDLQSDTITLRGEQAQLGPALTLVYSKANSVKTEFMDVPSWLHKYIIGKKGANIKNLTQDLTKVQVDFVDDRIKVEGPKEEIVEAIKRLKEMIENLKQQVAFEEVKVNPSCHRHIIGKNGANINRWKEETKTQINIPPEGDNNIIRIEGPPEGVADVKKYLLEMVSKMENEIQRELSIEQRFHRTVIGTKGEKIREVRDKFNQVNITFPEPGFKSDKVIIRGPKPDVDSCYKHLHKMNDEMRINNFTVEVPIYKKHHKLIIGKNGANIKKIRDETNTRIDLPAEGSESEIIIIRGRKEDVLMARDKVLEIQNGQANIVDKEILIPAKLHNSIIGTKGKLIRSITDDCGGVTIKFPTEGSGSDKVSIRGPKEEVEKAKATLIELSKEKQLTSFTAEIKARPDQHKFLIGKNGVNIKKVRDKTGARIVFPSETDDEKDTITIIGRKEEVEAAKKELTSIISELANTAEASIEIEQKHHRYFVAKRAEELRKIEEEFGGVTVSFPKFGSDSTTVVLKGAKDCLEGAKQRLLEIVKNLENTAEAKVDIDRKHHRYFVARRAEVLRKIAEEYGGVSVSFPKAGSDSSEVVLKGAKDYLEGARNRLLEIVKELESMVEVECVIPQEHHRTVLGSKGYNVQNVQQEFNVTIKFPDREKPDDFERGTMNGDLHSEEVAEPESNERNIIKVKGKKENCEAACKALQDLVPISEEMEVPYDLHRFIIGQKGKDVRSMMEKYDVNIVIPPVGEHSDIVIIRGSSENVARAKEAMKERMEQLELEKQDRLLRGFQLTVEVDPQYHPKIIGRGGAVINKIRKEYNVNINLPDREGTDGLITIQGYEKDATAAREAILSLVQEQENLYKEEVSIDSRIHPRIIGGKGRNVNRIMEQFKVDIRFPRSSDDPNLVIIQGAEDDVLDAKDHLLNLEEEYLQDISERDFMQKYTKPPSRNGTHDPDRGFVVKGAPWDRKGAAPDTSNTQEFPSFGSSGDIPPKVMPQWGPSRR